MPFRSIAANSRTLGPNIELSHLMWHAGIKFELLELLGEGSQGRVHKATRIDRASGLRQTIAIKILHSETAVALWRHEFESLSRVRSPYCVQVMSFERYRRSPALVLEFVDGISLTILGQTCLLESADVQEILAQLEAGLKDLHNEGIIHGDLSPHNVLIDRSGRIRILDFGIANCDPAHARVTPEFASPERLLGHPADIASDMFALGKMELYLRGEAPSQLPLSYCHQDPTQRRFHDLRPCVNRQAQLGEKIEMLIERRKRNGELKTLTQNIQRPRPWSLKAFVLGSITSILVLTTSSASQSPPRIKLALLNLRTQKWHYFLLNGQPLGYAPISLAVNAEEAQTLQWISATGRGETALVLKPQEVKTLEDSDFSH